VAAGGVLAASAVGLALVTGAPANAASTTSTAYGVSATGADPVAATPSVSSSAAVKSASGSAASGAGTFTASGMTVTAGAGVATATVGSLTVAGHTIATDIFAKCSDGKTKYGYTPPKSGAVSASNLKVSFGGGAGAVVTIVDGHGKSIETITAAVVACGQGTPPPTTVPPTSQPTGQPTGRPTSQPTTGRKPGKTRTPVRRIPVGVAPAPTPEPGHHAVTG
jgi:hypothetical protein